MRDRPIPALRSCPAIVILLLLVSLAACKEPDHYKQGMALLDKKDYAKAHIEFRRAMTTKQGTAETYYEAGVTAMKLKGYQEAIKYFTSAENLAGPKGKLAEDIKLNLAELALLTRDFKGTRDRARWVLERDPNSTRARQLLVLALTALAEPEMAADELDLWLAADPNSQEARMIRTGIFLAKEDVPDAVKQLEDAAQQPTRTQATLIALGNVYQVAQDYPKAEQAYLQALPLNPDNMEPRKGLGWLYARMGKRDKAIEMFNQIRALKPKDPEARGALASYYLALHEWALAIAELEQLIKEDATDRFNASRLASAYLLSGRAADADKLIKSLLTLDPTDPQAQLLAGVVALQGGRWDEAIVYFHSSAEVKNSAITQFFLGSAENHKGNERQAQAAMTRALHLDPYLLGARLWLAEYWLRQSAPLSAVSLLEGDPQGKRPSPITQLLKARSYLALGNYEMAAREFGAVRKEYPTLVPAFYEASFRFLMKRQWSQARVPLEEGLAKDPGSINLLAVVAQTWIAERKPERAVARVLQQVEKFPTSSIHFQLLAETQRAAGDIASAKVSYERAVTLSPESPGPLLGLTQTLVTSGKKEEAKSKLMDLTKRWPQWSQSWTLYAAFEEMQNDYPEAISAYERAVTLDSSNALALNNLAWRLYSDGGDMDRARQLAQKAREIQEDNPAYADTLGMILFRMGSRTEAEKELAFAVHRQPGNPEFQQHLAAVQGKRPGR